MARHFTVFFVFFAILLGGSGLPALVHVYDGPAGHELEMVDAWTNKVDVDQSSSNTPRDIAGHAGHHHHGAEALRLALPESLPAMYIARAECFMALTVPLTSLSQAPPTEPPSA